MNDRFDLRIITQPHSQVYWGYFRRLVFGNSSTKHIKLIYFSNSILFCSDVLLPFSHIPPCFHAKTPDFPRLFEPREPIPIHFLNTLQNMAFLLVCTHKEYLCILLYNCSLWLSWVSEVQLVNLYLWVSVSYCGTIRYDTIFIPSWMYIYNYTIFVAQPNIYNMQETYAETHW